MARHPDFVGPSPTVAVTKANMHELQEKHYFVDEKMDGCWCRLETDQEGVVVSLVGRSQKEFKQSHVKGLLGENIGLPSTVLAGELETASQSATQARLQAGRNFRRFHAFELLQYNGTDYRLSHDNWERKKILERVIGTTLKPDRILEVRKWEFGFWDAYLFVAKGGGEGLVAKPKHGYYEPRVVRGGSHNGKRKDWFKIKEINTVDYICRSIGHTELGNPFMELFLVVDGEEKRTSKVQCPANGMDPDSFVGRVIEIKGAEIFDSGVVRHGRFSRVRDDKAPEECTLEAALDARPSARH